MKRFVTGISFLCIGMALCASPQAWAKKKHKKHHKTRYSAVNSNPLAGLNTKQPDAQLFDKAMKAMRKGRYTVARLDLQTLLNAYPDTEYAMRAKLAIGDTWYLEGGPAALQQAAAEYRDFITFFPNAPEAAEAQMKIGDIYFKQMERPDRDPTNAFKAQKEYRTMIEQFPNSPLLPRAKQKLREVQEVLAQRQFEVGQFYATREDWPGSIARLQTVADLYPLFSKSCETLIMLGDDYANEAARIQNMKMPAKPKNELLAYYNGRAAQAWNRAVTHYPMSPTVDQAKDRLIAMGRPIPEPTPQQLAQSEAEEASRVPVKFKTRALDFFTRSGATPVEAARVGQPTLKDPSQTYAPSIARQQEAVFIAAMHGKPLTSAEAQPQKAKNNNTIQTVSPAQNSGGSNEVTPTATFQTVPTGSGNSTSGSGNSATVEVVPSTSTANRPAEINGKPIPSPDSKPIAAAVGPHNPGALPAVKKPTAAPDQINDVKNGGNTNLAAQNTNGKHKKKAKFNRKEESSSRHKPRKGLKKLNPFHNPF
jgi:outer membrane protein assembly factor BamD